MRAAGPGLVDVTRTVPLLVLPPVVAGVAVALNPLLTLVAAVVVGLAIAVWWHPPIAAYFAIGVTPLVAGIDRGTLIPVLRPHEALVAFLIGVLALRWLVRPRSQTLPRWHRVDTALLLLAFTSSVIPIAWLMVRGLPITGDDVSYALMLWKYAAVYALVRLTVATIDQVRRCLLISVAAAGVVGGIAIMQVLNLFGVRSILVEYFVTLDHVGAIDLPRASSTLALPAATADLLVFNAAIAAGLWFSLRRYRVFLAAAIAVFVVGTFAAAEFSSAFGLVVAVVCIAIALRVPAMIGWLIPAAAAAIALMWPLVSHRLDGFSSAYGLPVSWLGRLHNLETYFWPQLGDGANLLLGVQPSARVTVSSQVTGYVWIESGYTWLLWAGGVPLLLAFVYFVVTTVRMAWAQSQLASVARATGVATLSAVTVVTVLMIFDPHLTYRGSADCFFSLLALAVLVSRMPAASGDGPGHVTERKETCVENSSHA